MSDAASIAEAKQAFRAYVEASRAPNRQACDAFYADDAAINVVHPFNELNPEGFATDFLEPLQTAFAHLTRTDYIAFGGAFEDCTWVTSTGYYTGHFTAPFLGIAPTGALAHLRFGEFHRIENARAVESYIYLDIPELMIAAGQWPITQSPGHARGYTGYQAGPIPQDGLCWEAGDPSESQASYQMVTDMLRALATPDEGWRPFWDENMLWYGPAAFGSFIGIENFAGFQVPFEAAFDGWSGGASNNGMTAHFARFADGAYTCSGGWPSLTGVQVKPFLGQAAQNKRIYMRVCDWWRREGDKLMENWVFVDIPHALLQLGFDVFAPENRRTS